MILCRLLIACDLFGSVEARGGSNNEAMILIHRKKTHVIFVVSLIYTHTLHATAHHAHALTVARSISPSPEVKLSCRLAGLPFARRSVTCWGVRGGRRACVDANTNNVNACRRACDKTFPQRCFVRQKTAGVNPNTLKACGFFQRHALCWIQTHSQECVLPLCWSGSDPVCSDCSDRPPRLPSLCQRPGSPCWKLRHMLNSHWTAERGPPVH